MASSSPARYGARPEASICIAPGLPRGRACQAQTVLPAVVSRCPEVDIIRDVEA